MQTSACYYLSMREGDALLVRIAAFLVLALAFAVYLWAMAEMRILVIVLATVPAFVLFAVLNAFAVLIMDVGALRKQLAPKETKKRASAPRSSV